jgi:hypothetical protein
MILNSCCSSTSAYRIQTSSERLKATCHCWLHVILKAVRLPNPLTLRYSLHVTSCDFSWALSSSLSREVSIGMSAGAKPVLAVDEMEAAPPG